MTAGLLSRAIAFTPLALALWWFWLKGASLWLLRVVAYLPFGLFIAPAGMEPIDVKPSGNEWVFRVQLDAIARNQQTGQMQSIPAAEFTVDPDSIAIFTSGWFSYATLAWSAVGLSRRGAAPMLKGLGIQTVVNILALGSYVYINAYGAVVNASPGQAAASLWLLKYFYHIVYLVIPFASPFAIALTVHPEWRAQFVATQSEPQPSSVKKPVRPRTKAAAHPADPARTG